MNGLMPVIALLKTHEGLELFPYLCPAGKLTIGYGHNLEDNGITRQQANAMLVDDVQVVLTELRNRFYFFESLDAVRAAVLVDMCFNLGLPRLETFVKFLAAVELGDYPTAANEMIDSRWYNQVGERAVTLVAMMRSGEWPSLVV